MRTRLLFLCLLLCMAILSGCTADPLPTDPTPPSADSTELSINFTHDTGPAFPFIYDENDEWLNSYIVEYDYVPGYLYIMNSSKTEITAVLEEPVKIIRETPNTIFCVTADDTIVQTDYAISYRKTIYEATQGPITGCERLEHTLYFIEGNSVIQLDIPTGTSTVLLEHEAGIDTAFMTDWNTLLWRDTNGQHYVLDLATGTITPLTEIEYDMYFGTAITP